MRFTTALLAVAPLAAASSLENQFEFVQWVSKHGKSYPTVEEYTVRFANWIKKNEWLVNHRATAVDATYTVDHNQFSDWSEEEFQAILTGKVDEADLADHSNDADESDYVEAPLEAISNGAFFSNWCDKGACNAIVDQGQCGSCWAFAGAAVMEGRHQIHHHVLEKISEQECVDCSTESFGCDGGYQNSCFKVSLEKNGLDRSSDYLYTGKDGSCSPRGNGPLKANTYSNVTRNSEGKMLSALFSGPISMYVNAHDSFGSYSGGILNDTSCGTQGNHFIALVGYGTDSNGVNYWYARNSWGTGWGESGHIKLQRKGENNMGICGSQSMTSFPQMA